MSGEQSKPSHEVAENAQPPMIPFPSHPGAYTLPPGAYPPMFFGPPPEGVGQGSDMNAQYPVPFPQMMYVYPPPGSGSPFHALMQSNDGKPKRKQVKMACTNCAAACKKCDDGRPCQRCVKSNLTDTCRDGVRKERKKGVKRGPYKRRAKNHSDEDSEGSNQVPPLHPPIPGPMPEGYFPFFLPPPPPGFFQGEGQNGPPPQIQFYPYQQFPPFTFPGGVPVPYPHPHMIPPPVPGPPQDSQQGTAPPNDAGPARSKKRRRDDDKSDVVAKKAKSDKSGDGSGSSSSPGALAEDQ